MFARGLTFKYNNMRVCFMTKWLIRTMSSVTTDDVLFQSVKDKGIIILNRPNALNTINLRMCKKIHSVLKQWEKEKSLVIIKGTGEKAFCAGGDVRAIAESGLKGDLSAAKNQVRCGYTLYNLIGSYQIPYVALIHGITMGLGVGISVHGTYQVATETTVFAMPETAIGVFPGAGGSFFLPRLDGKLGLFLALSGYHLKGRDVVKAGIASHFCDNCQLAELEKALISCTDPQNEVGEILDEFAQKSLGNEGEFGLAPYVKRINQCFSASSVEDILQNLKDDSSDWAMKTLSTLKKMSPSALKITHRVMEEGSTKSLRECLIMEYHLTVNVLDSHDFLEGVKALLIDKNRTPKWIPNTLKGVTPDMVNIAFAQFVPEEELEL